MPACLGASLVCLGASLVSAFYTRASPLVIALILHTAFFGLLPIKEDQMNLWVLLHFMDLLNIAESLCVSSTKQDATRNSQSMSPLQQHVSQDESQNWTHSFVSA